MHGGLLLWSMLSVRDGSRGVEEGQGVVRYVDREVEKALNPDPTPYPFRARLAVSYPYPHTYIFLFTQALESHVIDNIAASPGHNFD